MSARLQLGAKASDRFLGTRYTGMSLRQELDVLLADNESVMLDFSGLSVTQSFIDELIGALILKRGPGVVSHLVFKGCSDDVRAIIRFVVDSRVADYAGEYQH